MEISHTSPVFMNTGGVLEKPTPPGVPVARMSPGCSGAMVDAYSMNRGILCTMLSAGVVLHDLAIQGGPDAQAVDLIVLDLASRHDPRAQGAAAKEVLSGRDLAGVELPVADAAFVHDRVAGHMLERVFLPDPVAAACR